MKRDLLLSSYDYKLDQRLIAQEPLDPRHEARLMLISKELQKNSLGIKHLKVWDLVDELHAGDLIVMNDTRVLKARVRVRLASGSLAELLLLEPQGEGLWLCLGKPAKKMKPGDYLWLESLEQEPVRLQVIRKDNLTGGRVVQFPKCFSERETIENFLERYGEVPLPPYIQRHDSTDESRYQTRYASRPGAVAAPTAGLHLSDELLNAFQLRGIRQVSVTLHVGLGTFRPLEKEDLIDLELHKEWVEVKQEVIDAIADCQARGGRVIAVGTTTVRSLEASFALGDGSLIPFKGSVDLVIKPGHQFGAIDGLLTNFHLPKSSLLLLVSALIGRERLLAVYKEAIDRRYRFFSYGDAMLITPEAVLPEARS
ncbi:S-adenosylmethionine:tRNA ribosyltransferase-isomerase [Prochlorococcus sp. MIT 0601]|nr:S-adenosylmethionine:tRNA ribosyltransferase-isomerase [Prochlorococcus sp. MIT 0601]